MSDSLHDLIYDWNLGTEQASWPTPKKKAGPQCVALEISGVRRRSET
jgi:hypothetical protein